MCVYEDAINGEKRKQFIKSKRKRGKKNSVHTDRYIHSTVCMRHVCVLNFGNGCGSVLRLQFCAHLNIIMIYNLYICVCVCARYIVLFIEYVENDNYSKIKLK